MMVREIVVTVFDGLENRCASGNLLASASSSTSSAVMLTTPILLPIILHLGFSPIHYAAIVGVNTGLGNITPPCAPMLYLGGRLNNSPINETLKPTLWMILFAWIPTLAITTYIPQLSMWLPHVVLGTPM